MLVIVKQGTSQEKIDVLRNFLAGLGVTVQYIQGEETIMLGLAGDTTRVDAGVILRQPDVERIVKVQEPYKKANRRFHPQDTVINVGSREIGGKKICIMAGPCSVESEDQILAVARDVSRSGAHILRGGAFKPRSSPYAFQGMGTEGLDLLMLARRKTGMPIVSELMSTEHLDIFNREVDIIQVGARNMQNFDLLKELGRLRKPILLKRGLSSTLDELLMSAEYIMAGGNEQVILCERGIRTYETATRNTLDLSAVPVLKRLTHLPVIVDPSHATGMWWLVEPMAMAAVAAGADGLIIEVHNNPPAAKCDGQQSLTPELFHQLMGKLTKLAEVVGREV